MFYEPELTFFQNILNNLQLPVRLVESHNLSLSQIDLGLREMLGFTQEYEKLRDFFRKGIRPNKIYKITDIFYCTYIALLLPDTAVPTLLLIGPYTAAEIPQQKLMQFIENYSISPQFFPTFEQYYYNIPVVHEDTTIWALINTLAEKIWNGSENYSIESIDQETIGGIGTADLQPIVPAHEDNLFKMKALEHRYEVENQFLQAVAHGLSHKAEMLITNTTFDYIEQRTVDPLRNFKNYAIIMNTLLRKAAERGKVHPLHIDQLSSLFARKIESVNSPETGMKLTQEMIHKYCLLVKNHSMKDYSLLVQKTITRIDSDLTADLGLNAMASLLNVNPSYLSTLFKKETGSTLTDYVNRRRIEHAILLLNSTTLQIQTIAQYCGISDVNYFTKTFKKYIHCTPNEYRKNIRQTSGEFSFRQKKN